MGLGQMQQQALEELISEALSHGSAALKLLHRIGVRLRRGRYPKLDRLAARDRELRKLLT